MKRLTALNLIGVQPRREADPILLVDKMPDEAAAKEMDLQRASALIRTRRSSCRNIAYLVASTLPMELAHRALQPSAASVTANLAFIRGLAAEISNQRAQLTAGLEDAPGVVATVIPSETVDVDSILDFEIDIIMKKADSFLRVAASQLDIKGIAATAIDFSFNEDSNSKEGIRLQPHLQFLFAHPLGRSRQAILRNLLVRCDWVSRKQTAIKIMPFQHVAKQVAYFSKVEVWRRATYKDRDGISRTNKHLRPQSGHRYDLISRMARYDIDDRAIVYSL